MNFTYLSSFPRFKKLYEYCSEAEEFAISKPNISAASARKAMEFIVKLIYQSEIDNNYGMTVFEMITDARFQAFVGDESLINSIHFIRKMGNIAAHDASLASDDALDSLDELHFLVGEFCIMLGLIKDYPQFVEPTIAPPVTKAEVAKAESTLKEKVEVPQELMTEFAARMRETRFNVQHGRDESENKQLYLRASLREAGWAIAKVQNQAIPESASINLILDDGDTVDYVLYGRDNRPLAIIEYTSTNKNLIEGRTKAIEKANKMEKKYGYKPVVYYTNGYYIYIIDQLGYKPRRVFQFHSIEELELLKLRATMRLGISAPQIDENIAGRDYQKKAITAACQAFMQNRRHALLVMATGTGKTRVSIATVDVLMKSNWVKNVLFLADRTSLVRQAHKNFTKLLPNVTTSVYSGGSLNRDPNARIIFSTYQTMINLINDDTREFGIGRFDLIIIDEAHRSIFKKYSVLFHYFDALMIGLTATPRCEENKSTYQMFELKDGQPDFAYELEAAIDDGYLVGFHVLDKTTDKMRRGIVYDELTDDQKTEFEDSFATGDYLGNPTDYSGTVVSAAAVGRRVINLGTIDAMLNDLMKNGLKINAGDKLGKTIIFADSHFEAEKIVERFVYLYPHLGVDFCKLVDCHVENSLGIIDTFGERDSMPQITVSVDMMDTGIDVPNVLNLVFFKQVFSKIKFLQMIGRGTRLCNDIYGPGEHKSGFLIFDYFDNFHYFSTRNTWSTLGDLKNPQGMNVTPQTILINQRKLAILRYLTESSKLSKFDENYRDELKDYFITAVRGLNNDDLEVQYNMAYVSKYRTAEMWEHFSNDKINEIEAHIVPLLPPDSAKAKVKSFDLLIYVMESEIPQRIKEGKDIRKIRNGFLNVGSALTERMEALQKLKTSPAIVQKEARIKSMIDGNYLFHNFSLENCENVRKELRDLMQYIPDKKQYYVINADDYIIEGNDDGSEITKEKTYAEKAREYLSKTTPALAKIQNLDELTEEEKQELNDVFTSQLGNAADYVAWSNNVPLLPFLRIQLGIADAAILTKFGVFYNENTLDSEQMEYMAQIINYAKENGDITFMDLQRISPFCDVDIMELFGPKIGYIKTLINGLHKPVI